MTRKQIAKPTPRRGKQTRSNDVVEALEMQANQINEVSEKIRNDTLEEVAKAVLNFKAFEKVTMDSFAAYIRGMKR